MKKVCCLPSQVLQFIAKMTRQRKNCLKSSSKMKLASIGMQACTEKEPTVCLRVVGCNGELNLLLRALIHIAIL